MNFSTKQQFEPEVDLSVNEEPWNFVAGFASSGPNDPVYTFNRESGLISFGNGINGKSLPVGSRIKATYKFGDGDAGNIEPETSISLEWTAESPSKKYAMGVNSLITTNDVIFRVCPILEGSREFRFADMLLGQIKSIKKHTFGDLVLSVLPWPFHKDLPNQSTSLSESSTGRISAIEIPAIVLFYICQRFSICSLFKKKKNP